MNTDKLFIDGRWVEPSSAEKIEVVNPYIYIRFNPDGTTNLPALQSRKDAPRRFEVQIGRVLVQGGTLQLDETRLPLEIDALYLSGSADGITQAFAVSSLLVIMAVIVLVIKNIAEYRGRRTDGR